MCTVADPVPERRARDHLRHGWGQGTMSSLIKQRSGGDDAWPMLR
jgi:hypothetical protein